MKDLSEVEQWEQDIERTIPLKDETNCKFLKSKAVLAGFSRTEDCDQELEITSSNGGGFYFRFTTQEERAVEKIVECDLGHKHRALKKEDYHYHGFSISKKDARLLLQWLKQHQ